MVTYPLYSHQVSYTEPREHACNVSVSGQL